MRNLATATREELIAIIEALAVQAVAGLVARTPDAPHRVLAQRIMKHLKMFAFEVGRKHHVWRRKPRLGASSAVYGLEVGCDDI